MAGFSIGSFSVTGLTNPQAIVLFILCFFVVLFGGHKCCRRRNRQPQQRSDEIVQMGPINIYVENPEGEPSGGHQAVRLPGMYAPAYYPRDDEMAEMYASAYHPRDDQMAEDDHTNGEYAENEFITYLSA